MNDKVGKLLIANPNVPSDNPFAKSVIYIYNDHPLKGSTGVILNKPSSTTVQEMCYDQRIAYHQTNHKVHIGGPVNPQALVLLHTDEWQSQNTVYASNTLCISSDKLMFLKLSQGDEPAYWRMFVGYSGWAPKQLDMELTGQAPYDKLSRWLTAEANDDIIFGYDGVDQWNKALELCSQQTVDQWF